MPVGNPNIREVSKGTQFKPGQSGNPSGPKPGYKHINTHIQELMNDEKFTIMIQEGYEVREYKGKPINALLQAQLRLALQSKDENIRIKATELLMKHGWSQKIEQDTKITLVNPIMKLDDTTEDIQPSVIDL